MWIKMISKEITYRPPGLLFSVSLSTNLLCNSWIKFNWERLKTKSHCHCVTRVRKSFSPPVDPLNTWFDFYKFTEVDDEWCDIRATEPKQNISFQLKFKRPTCASNLDTPRSPWAFFSLSLNCCHTEHFPPLKL